MLAIAVTSPFEFTCPAWRRVVAAQTKWLRRGQYRGVVRSRAMP